MKPALDEMVESISGKTARNCFMTRMIDTKPWSKPNKSPPMVAATEHPTTRPFEVMAWRVGLPYASDKASASLASS